MGEERLSWNTRCPRLSRRREDIPGTTWWTVSIALCALFPEGHFSLPSEDRERRSLEYICKVKSLFISFQGLTAGVLEVHSCFSCSKNSLYVLVINVLCLSVNNIIKVTTVYVLILTATIKVHFKIENTITTLKHVYIKIF